MTYVDELPPEDPYAPSVPEVDPIVLMERRVIGAAMRHPHEVKDLQREVSSGDFYDLRLGAIFAGIQRMVAEGIPVDYLSVWDKLGEWDVRGIELTDLTAWESDATGSGAYYGGLVREASMRRLMAMVGEQLQAGGRDVGAVLARATEDLRKLRDISSAGGKSVRWLREVLDVPAEADAYEWVIPDLLEKQDRLMLSAAEGSGKSTLLRQVAILGAAGIHPTRFSQIDPIDVLVIDAENSERQWRRASRELTATATQRGRRDPRDHLALHCVPVMDIARPNDLGQIHRWIDEAKPDLLLLGPLYRMTKGSLNDDDDVAPVLAALDSIRERNVAMLIEVHAGHARSTSGERELRPRGSSALLGWPEFGLGLRRERKAEGPVAKYSLVRWRGDRDQRDWPARLVRGQTWPWEPTY